MNKITFTGRIVADSELRFIPSGEPVLSFRVASDVGYGEKKSTNWFQCQVWGKRGESLSQRLTKGLPVTVWGTLTLREWSDKEGQKKLSPDIRVDEVEMHGKSESVPAQKAANSAKPEKSGSFDAMDDEVPF